MAEHQGSDVRTKTALLDEANRLVRSILGSGGGGSHPKTLKAVTDFLIQFRGGAGIPWVRMYQLFPAWQEQCGLLNQEWDRDAVLERAKVIFTLINTHGNTIRRMALGGGTWKGTGAETIGNHLVLTKLYYKRDGASRPREEGFTVFEFHLTMDLQPQVAICVLHRTDYRHAIRDLREYIHEGKIPGGNQAELQMVQPLGLINSAPVIGGLMNGAQFDQTINQPSGNESIEYYHAPLGNSLISLPNTWPMNDPYDTTMSFGYNHALQGDSVTILSNTWPINGNYYDMSTNVAHVSHRNSMMGLSNTWAMNGIANTYDTITSVGYDHALPRSPTTTSIYNNRPMNGIPYDRTVLPEQVSTDLVSMQNDSSITSFGNSMGTPNWNAMTSENEPPLPDTSPCGEHLVSTAQNYPQEEHFSFPVFSEHISTFETNDNVPFLEPFPPAEYDSEATAHNYPRDEYSQFSDFFWK